MTKILSRISGEDMEAFFAELSRASRAVPDLNGYAEDLARFFNELPDISTNESNAPSPTPEHSNLATLFFDLKPRLDELKSRGGLVNLWQLAGLKLDEVRTAGALAGLWRTDFGGDVSCDFLASYLGRAVKQVDWRQELSKGYAVSTEVNPLGDRSDRVDLVIETQGYLIGVEVKIRARLGFMQLDRYSGALVSRAMHIKKSPILILLAPFPSGTSDVASSSWSDVAVAARDATRTAKRAKTFFHHVIAQFGNHIARH